MLPSRPVWLGDEPEIEAWLHEVLHRLDALPGEERSAPLRFPVNAKRFPNLFRQGPEADAEWALIKSLHEQLPLNVVPKRKTNPFAPEYEGARLDLDTACEETIRHWLRRPRLSLEAEAWREAVDGAQWRDEVRMLLRQRPIAIPGRSAQEVVTALRCVGELLGQGLTLRQLSARAFFGDSKFMESRSGLMQSVFPDLVAAARPLLVATALPATISGVLFVENHDTYLRAASGGYPGTKGLAVVYAAGYKGSATRIREHDGAALHYFGASTAAGDFERWWFRERGPEWPVWFWGDLDFEGLRILKALREQFGASAWQPGYEPLVALLRAGFGHTPDAADKSNQRVPGPTGCPYADEVLLPLLLQERRFVDQEAW